MQISVVSHRELNENYRNLERYCVLLERLPKLPRDKFPGANFLSKLEQYDRKFANLAIRITVCYSGCSWRYDFYTYMRHRLLSKSSKGAT